MPSVEGKRLENEDGGECVEIDPVNSAVNEPIARNAKQDQTIQGGIEEAVVEHEIEAAKGCVHELASGDEDQAPMVFRLFSPINREGHAGTEDDHVDERNRHERRYVFLMEHQGIEAGHDNSDGEAQDDHERGKGGSKPAEQTVHADPMRAHEGGLTDEEDDPSGEGSTVQPQEPGSWRVGVEEVGIDRAAETPSDKDGQNQRHGEIEVAAQECLELELPGCAGLLRDRSS